MENLFHFYQAEAEDKRIINNLAKAFQDNARMRVLLGKQRDDFLKRITQVISYSYFMVKKIGGLFISKDQNTYLLYYTKSQLYFSIKDYFNYFFLAFRIVGLKRLRKVYLREKKIKNTRQKEIKKQRDKDYLYVWFMAQKKEHQGVKGLMEAKTFIFDQSLKHRLPIYLETTEKRLVPLYEKMGFKFYDILKEEDTKLLMWFGRYAES